MRTLLLATTNPGKLKELLALCPPGLALKTLAEFPGLPEVVEDGASFEENARKKALAACLGTGLPALADDSGLCVDALGGRPGVLSARYAPGSDADRVAKLLAELAVVPPAERSAHFRCALCLALPGGERVEVAGRCDGLIAEAPRGSGGFGYDPVFLLPSKDKTFGELGAGEKHAHSHRGRALAKLAPHLDRLFR